MIARTLLALALLAAAPSPISAAERDTRMTVTVVTAAKLGNGKPPAIEQHDLSGPMSREMCAAIEAVVATMRAAGIDRSTTARCAPAGDQI